MDKKKELDTDRLLKLSYALKPNSYDVNYVFELLEDGYDLSSWSHRILCELCFIGDLESIKRMMKDYGYNANFELLQNELLYRAARGLNENVIVYLLSLGYELKYEFWVKKGAFQWKNHYTYKIIVENVIKKMSL